MLCDFIPGRFANRFGYPTCKANIHPTRIEQDCSKVLIVLVLVDAKLNAQSRETRFQLIVAVELCVVDAKQSLNDAIGGSTI